MGQRRGPLLPPPHPPESAPGPGSVKTNIRTQNHGKTKYAENVTTRIRSGFGAFKNCTGKRERDYIQRTRWPREKTVPVHSNTGDRGPRRTIMNDNYCNFDRPSGQKPRDRRFADRLPRRIHNKTMPRTKRDLHSGQGDIPPRPNTETDRPGKEGGSRPVHARHI